jgi:hypothetical protein
VCEYHLVGANRQKIVSPQPNQISILKNQLENSLGKSLAVNCRPSVIIKKKLIISKRRRHSQLSAGKKSKIIMLPALKDLSAIAKQKSAKSNVVCALGIKA